MEKGSIYYDTKKNIYHLITSYISLDNRVESMMIEGYQTQHRYLATMEVSGDFFEKSDERYVQVGGIY